MTTLKTNFLGFELENSWCVASGPASATGKMIASAFEAGWGACITKTLGPTEEPITNIAPRIHTLRKWNREIAMQNLDLITDRKFSIWLAELKKLRRRFPKKMIIASIMAPGHELSTWERLVRQMNQVGCNAIELNLGCPHGMPERGMGSICSQDPQLVSNIVKAAKSASKIPILAKLTPNITDNGTLIMPWKLIASPSGYIFTWLIGYSSLLGAIGGIMIVDYFLIRKQILTVDELYVENGRYWFCRGFNVRAIIAFLIGVAPNLPGFLSTIGCIRANSIPEAYLEIYHHAWFVGFAVSFVSYYLLSRQSIPINKSGA